MSGWTVTRPEPDALQAGLQSGLGCQGFHGKEFVLE